MKVRFYCIHKGTRVAVVHGTTILHQFIGKTETPSEVTFDVVPPGDQLIYLRARHPQSHGVVELSYASLKRHVSITCQNVYQQWDPE